MNITFILKGDLETLPPMLPRLLAFSKKGPTVRFVCTKMTQKNEMLLSSAGICCFQTNHKVRILQKESRIMDWKNFRSSVKKYLRGDGATTDLLYICSADTALCLGSLLKNKRFVLQSNELYDTLPMYKNGLRKFMQNAVAVVVPEFCRANLCAYWYGLKKLPFVIPNIPYAQSLEKRQAIDDPAAAEVIDKLKDKKILIYQGHITSGDRSLTVIAEALRRMEDPSFVLLLMGRDHDSSVQKLRDIYEGTYYVPFVPAPGHLQITSHAFIGLLSYDRVSMNNLFCAPNKIFEYSGFGIPMLGNNIPGLKYCLEHDSIGLCADYEDANCVVSKIRQLEENHSVYAKNSLNYYNSIRMEEKIEELLREL